MLPIEAKKKKSPSDRLLIAINSSSFGSNLIKQTILSQVRIFNWPQNQRSCTRKALINRPKEQNPITHKKT